MYLACLHARSRRPAVFCLFKLYFKLQESKGFLIFFLSLKYLVHCDTQNMLGCWWKMRLTFKICNILLHYPIWKILPPNLFKSKIQKLGLVLALATHILKIKYNYPGRQLRKKKKIYKIQSLPSSKGTNRCRGNCVYLNTTKCDSNNKCP